MAPMADPQHLELVRELAALEHPTWSARTAALLRSGVPLNVDPPPDPAPADPPPTDPPADPAPTDPPTDPAADDPPVFDRAYVEQLRRENARYRTEAQALRQAEEQRADAERTELERAQAAAQRAEAEATELRLDALRRDVADATPGLDPRLAGRLRGTTREELEADAAELASLAPRPTPGAPPPAPTPPVPGGPQNPAGDKPLTADAVRKLAAENPTEFNRLYEAGEIPATALQGK